MPIKIQNAPLSALYAFDKTMSYRDVILDQLIARNSREHVFHEMVVASKHMSPYCNDAHCLFLRTQCSSSLPRSKVVEPTR